MKVSKCGLCQGRMQKKNARMLAHLHSIKELGYKYKEPRQFQQQHQEI